MRELFSRFKRGGARPIRRILALDAGSRRIRMLLAESGFGRPKIVRQEAIDLNEEGLVSTEEVRSHLEAMVQEWGDPPIALVLPQHISTSQIVDLPAAPEEEVERLIREETLKLGGVSESKIIYDFVRIEPPEANRQQFWITLCQEGEIRERIAQLGLENQDLCEVTTVANALIAAYRVGNPTSSKAILVHAGAQATVVVILVAGQGASASSFDMGGDFFTRTLARLHSCSEETAETLKRGTNLLAGPQADPKFAAAVDGWIEELKRQLQDWFNQHRDVGLNLDAFEVAASGGAFNQPGLLEYARAKLGLRVAAWPSKSADGAAAPPKGFEPAYGAALQAMGFSPQPVSLLPEDYRANWRKRLGRERIEIASFLLLIICALLLGLGTWRQALLATHKKLLLEKVAAGQAAADANEALTSELVGEYETFRPLFASQANTVDVLSTLALLQQSRSNHSFWYVLVGDQQSYFTAPAASGSTNKPAKTGLGSSAAEKTFASANQGSTNVSSVRPGMIAELVVPEDAEVARITLSQLVKELKQQPLFAKVDLLSEDLRRDLADPKVIVPGRDYVLALDFAATNFSQALPGRKRAYQRGAARRPARSITETSELSRQGVP
jgi:Tfp pilus assembly PilM family ATPase